MKKKIKDLTLVEASKYCLSRNCENCPFKDEEEYCLLEYINGYRIETMFKDVLEREVEINESNFN